VAARLDPGRGVQGMQPDRLQVLPKPPGTRLWLTWFWLTWFWLTWFWLGRLWLGRFWLTWFWLGRLWLGRLRMARPHRLRCRSHDLPGGGKTLPAGREDAPRQGRCQLRPRVQGGRPGPGLAVPLLVRLLVRLIWLRAH
jgi:hypothetical protein